MIERRRDFPALQQKIRGKPIVYLDSACMSLIPEQVISAMNEYYENHPVCAERSVHSLGIKATEEFSKAREKISRFVGATQPQEIIFTKNATEGINLIANSLILKRGDCVLTTDKEHNSNFLPWMRLKEKGIEHRILRTKKDGTFDLDSFYAALDKRVKLVSMTHISNLDGAMIPKEIVKAAHENNSLVLLDGAQSAGHIPVDVKALDADIFVFSAHKMCGPVLGIVYCRQEVMAKLSPFLLGGGTVEDVKEDYSLLPSPQRFEAGIQNYACAIGAGAAADYLCAIGIDEIRRHNIKLNSYLDKRIREIDGIDILGPPAGMRHSITSFNIRGADPNQVGVALDEFSNVMVRSGMQCVHYWFNTHGIKGCVRASVYLYNTKEDVDIFVEGLEKVSGVFRNVI